VNAHTQRKLLGLVGLGVRGRGAVVGVQQVRNAAMKNQLAYAIVAPDASQHSLHKIVPLLDARHIRYVEGPSASDLGAAVGREATAVVGIVDHALARGIRKLLEADRAGGPRSDAGRAP
jgi:ribosomal protein L7Ae-like RNA K-turn-binding protein